MKKKDKENCVEGKAETLIVREPWQRKTNIKREHAVSQNTILNLVTSCNIFMQCPCSSFTTVM